MDVPLTINPDNIPETLRARKQWVLWRYEERDGKQTKVPHQINGDRASVASDFTWGRFKDVKLAYDTLDEGYTGIAYVLATNDPFVGIDLDDAIDEEGNIETWAKEIIERLNSYTEISPSGRGLRLFAEAAKPGPRCRIGTKPGFEVYDGKRLLSLTGHVIAGVPTKIEKRQDELNDLYFEIFPPDETEHDGRPGNSLIPNDNILIEKIKGSKQGPDFEALWTGSDGGYPSASEGDLAFCNIFAFWTGCDEGQMDRIFRASGRMRAKWDEKHGAHTYGEGTIQKAISGCGEVYEPPNAKQEAEEPKAEGQTEEEAEPGNNDITQEELDAVRLPEGPKFENRLPPDHFLTRYLGYGSDVSDAYSDFWYAGGLHILATLAAKKLKIVLRQGTLYSNIFALIAGKSSLSRKSTVIDRSEELLARVKPEILAEKIPTEFSPEAFIEHLADNNHAPWIRDEAAGVLSSMKREYMRGFKDSLMQLYDCKPFYRKLRTSRKKGVQTEFRVDDPYLNLLWATTDAALAANTELNDTLSGFMARFIYFFPQREKEKWLPLEEGTAHISILEDAVVAQLTRIAGRIEGMEPTSLHLSDGASEYYVEWQRIREKAWIASGDGNAMQIYSRLAPTVLKLAMLYELGSADFDQTKKIRPEFIKEACRQVDEYLLPTAQAVYESVGANAEKNVIDRIISFLKTRGGKATKREISRHVKIKSKELSEYIATMAEDGTIEVRTLQACGKTGRPAIWIYLSLPKNDSGQNSVPFVTNVTNVTSVTSVTSEDNSDDGVSDTNDTSDKRDVSDKSDKTHGVKKKDVGGEEADTEPAKSPYLADEPPNVSTIQRPTPTAKSRPTFEAQHLGLSAKYMGRISSEDLRTEFPDEEDRKKALYHLGILVQSYGWQTRKLKKSGLQTWWPPSEVSA